MAAAHTRESAHELKPFKQPVLLECNLPHVERTAGLAQFDLRRRLGVEVAATEARLAITGFNETLAVTVEGGRLAGVVGYTP